MSSPSGKHLAFPFHIGTDGRAATVEQIDPHVRDELVQLLLTNPGERPFLPEFGGGLRRLVFEPADEAARGMTKAMITQAISTWLGQRITLEDLQVDIQNATITVEIKFRLAGTADSRVLRFQRTNE